MKCQLEPPSDVGRNVTPSRTRRTILSAFKCLPPLAVAIFLVALACSTNQNAHATASFSRQTGMACNVCHTTFPELTEFGRQFKLNGYTLTNTEEVKEKGKGKEAPLSMLKYLPLSINLRGSYTQTGDDVPGTRNSNFEVPQQINLWFAGKLTDHLGSYTQMTYGVQANHFGFDNSDFLRYARQTKLSGKDLTWGLDFNNDPTFEDLWHSTPAYGFPWVAPDSVPGTNAAALIDNSLGGDVLGAGAYAMWDGHWYGYTGLYRTQHIGGPQPATGTDSSGTVPFAHNFKGAAPYWRFAYQTTKGDNFFEFGTYGIHANSWPGAISGPTDDFTDTALDLTYQRTFGKDLLTLHSTYIHEKQDLNATFAAGGASMVAHNLETFRWDAAYHFGNRFTVTGGTFLTHGAIDPLLYPAGAPGSASGSATGSPKTSGYIGQLAYWPTQNIEVGYQYKGYWKFNGGSTNFNGAGRNASGNNYNYVFIWLSF
jgi:hypothetical protein